MNTKIWRLTIIIGFAAVMTGTTRPVVAQAPLTGSGPTDPQEVEDFINPLITDFMADNHVPGGAIAIVKDGHLLIAKGYGYADLERQIPATGGGSLFRVGSISKVFTWTAVMQLVEQGKLDPNADVNSYLSHFQIPATFSQPITLADLMTHTAGFEEQMVDGTVYISEEKYQPLGDFLANKMPARIFPPGQIVAYSNYGAALAGEIVAEVSGEPFEEYIQNHILQPLAMHHSSFLQPLPVELAQDAVVGYEVDEAGIPHAKPFEFVHVRPAGAMSATASDMAKFMIANLQDGRYGEERILQAASAQDMRRQYYAFHPILPGMTRGFAEAYRNDLHLVLHPGTTEFSGSLLALLPDQNMGIFMTFNGPVGGGARINLLNALLDHYYPVPEQPQVDPPADFGQRAAGFTGAYLATRRAETNWGRAAAIMTDRISVMANADGTLAVDAFRGNDGAPKRWIEVAPLVFQEAGGQSLLAFQADDRGRITAMFTGDRPIVAFQKVTWYQDPNNQMIGLGLALLILVSTIVVWSLGGLRRLVRLSKKRLSPLESWGRFLAGGVSSLLLAAVGLVVYVLVGDVTAIQFGYPAGLTIAGILGLVAGIGSITVLIFAVITWWRRAGGVIGRLHYTLVAIAAFYCIWYLNYVNLLIIRF